MYSGTNKLVILAFPSLEFGGQEFTTNEDVAKFAATQEFTGTLMALGKVKDGPECQEIWRYLRLKTGAPEPKWNFSSKFLVSKTGEVSVSEGNLTMEIAALVEAN